MTRQEIEQKMDELAREYHDIHREARPRSAGARYSSNVIIRRSL
jgi:hypothetical protein